MKLIFYARFLKLVLSATRRSLVLVSLGCVCGWVSWWPSGHVARATLWGCGGLERRSVVVVCSICSLGKVVVRTVFVVRCHFVPLLSSLCCVVRGALRRLLSSGEGWARVRGLCLQRRCSYCRVVDRSHRCGRTLTMPSARCRVCVFMNLIFYARFLKLGPRSSTHTRGGS